MAILVRMLETTSGAEDGKTVKDYCKDEEYLMDDDLAKVFLNIEVAEIVKDEPEPEPEVEKPVEEAEAEQEPPAPPPPPPKQLIREGIDKKSTSEPQGDEMEAKQKSSAPENKMKSVPENKASDKTVSGAVRKLVRRGRKKG
jgi:SOS response regulatory protein OraA/RecX